MNRIAFRVYTSDPDLPDSAFRAILGQKLFGDAATSQAIDDALLLQRIFATRRTWCQAAPVVDPNRVKALHAAGRLDEGMRADIRAVLRAVREIESRYQGNRPEFAELHRIAKWVGEQWPEPTEQLLAP